MSLHPSIYYIIRGLQIFSKAAYLCFSVGATTFGAARMSNVGGYYSMFVLTLLTLLWVEAAMLYQWFSILPGNKKTIIGIDAVVWALCGATLITQLTIGSLECPLNTGGTWCSFFVVAITFGFINFALIIASTAWNILE